MHLILSILFAKADGYSFFEMVLQKMVILV